MAAYRYIAVVGRGKSYQLVNHGPFDPEWASLSMVDDEGVCYWGCTPTDRVENFSELIAAGTYRIVHDFGKLDDEADYFDYSELDYFVERNHCPIKKWNAQALLESNAVTPRTRTKQLCGFISPEGEFWQGSHEGHSDQARIIVAQLADYDAWEDGRYGTRWEGWLYERGWLAINYSGHLSGEKPNEKQIELLKAIDEIARSFKGEWEQRFTKHLASSIEARED